MAENNLVHLSNDTEFLIRQTFGSPPEHFEGVDLSPGASGGVRLAKSAYERTVKTVEDLHNQFKWIDEAVAKGDKGKNEAARQKSRLVKDAQHALDQIARNLEKLEKERDMARAQAMPETEIGDSVMAAIWKKLPADKAAVGTLYGDAIAAGDSLTAAAIERLPVAFDNRLGAEDLAELRRERAAAEQPENFAAFEAAEASAAEVERALHSARQHVESEGEGLPPPGDGGEVTTGPDGLRQLSASQMAEAMKS